MAGKIDSIPARTTSGLNSGYASPTMVMVSSWLSRMKLAAFESARPTASTTLGLRSAYSLVTCTPEYGIPSRASISSAIGVSIRWPTPRSCANSAAGIDDM